MEISPQEQRVIHLPNISFGIYPDGNPKELYNSYIEFLNNIETNKLKKWKDNGFKIKANNNHTYWVLFLAADENLKSQCTVLFLKGLPVTYEDAYEYAEYEYKISAQVAANKFNFTILGYPSQNPTKYVLVITPK